MGGFDFLPFLIGAWAPGLCMVSVIVLAMTRWRGSLLQRALSLTTLAYGVTYARLIARSAGFSPLMALYGVPTLRP
jgi:hypothetical protein